MDKFKWYVQAMAQPYEVQVGLFPDFVEVPDELALGWEQWSNTFQCKGQSLTAEQALAIKGLDRYLESISGSKNAAYWTMEALECSDQWGIVRRLAKDVLVAMNWAEVAPPKNSELFVGR